MLLEKIEQTNDIKQIAESDYGVLAQEIREFLIQSISETGGHLGSNLGAVELTMALHLFLNLPEDKIIWDVGHQSYTHKILTGRRDGFANLRKFGGMSGFPKRKESECDCFDTGHSSTSISAGLGMVKARDIKGEKNTIVSVIGDGSLTGGMAYEALNNASRLETNFIIILNDNNMSITPNVGAMSRHLAHLRVSPRYLSAKTRTKRFFGRLPFGGPLINMVSRTKSRLKQLLLPTTLFEQMGFAYLGPVDGHDLKSVCELLQAAKGMKKPVLLHVMTQKGKGYRLAEERPEKYHGVSKFDPETGQSASGGGMDFSAVLGDELIRLAYERTVYQKNAMNWPYMNKILQSWHQAGYRTQAQVEAEDRPASRSKPAQAQPRDFQPSQERVRKNNEWLKQFLEEQKKGEG